MKTNKLNLRLLMILCSIFLIPQTLIHAQTCITPPPNMSVWLPGDGNAQDILNNAQDLSVNGGVTFSAGKVAQAFNFDGTGDVIYSNINAGSAYTVDFWVRPTRSGVFESLISYNNNSSQFGAIRIVNGQVQYLKGNSGVVVGGSIPLNTYGHVALTYDGSVHRLYVNGNLVGTGGAQSDIFNNQISIGRARFDVGGSAGGPFVGQLDEIEIFSRALSQTEIQSIVNADSAGKCKTLVDADGDGIVDIRDACPNTPSGATVNASGCPVGACLTPPSNMINWFPGDGNANDIQGNNNGTPNGGVTFSAGKVAQAFNFDGTGSVAYSNINAGSAWTVDFWFRPTLAGGSVESLFSNNEGSQNFGSLRYNPNNDQVEYVQTSVARVVSGAGSVPPNVYTHVALTYDGSVNRLYINGNLVATSSVHTETFNNQINLGSDVGNTVNRFTGQIDEVEIFNRVLSLTEIRGIFNADGAGKCRPRCTPAPVNLVSWFPGDGNANDIRSGNTGILVGSGVTFAPGKVLQAFQFDTSGGTVRAPDATALDASDALTIDAWINPTATNGFALIVGKGDFGVANNQPYSIFFRGDSRITFRIGNSSTFDALDDATEIPLNAYTHIAATYDGATMRVYINGNLTSSKTTSIGMLVNSDRELIMGNVGAQYFGAVDELEIFKRALPQSEIQAIFNAGTAGKCKPTAILAPSNQVLWLPGDANANDISGNGSNGTLQDNASFAVGRVGQAFNFDGGRVVIPNVANLNVQTGDFAIEAWVNLRAYAGDGAFIAGKETCNGINRYALFVGGTGLPFITVRNSDGATFNAVSSNPIALGGWHHLAGVREGNTLKIFVNGQQTGTVTLSGSFAAQNLPFQIGNRDCILNSTVGLIDEVSVYSRALTTTEIQSIYNAGVAGKLKQTTTTGTTATVGDVTVTYSSAGMRTTQVTPLETADFPAPTMGTHTGLIYDIASSASPTGTVTVCFNLQAFNDATTFSRLRVLHFESTGWENRTSSSDFSTRTLCASVTSLSPFAIVLLPPTAAHVSVGGRVTMPNGKGIPRARVSLIDPSGNARFALTDFSGSYRFEAVEVGQTYVLSVSRKGYQFDQPTQVLFVNEDLNGVNFVALF